MNNGGFGYNQNREDAGNGEFYQSAPRPEEDISGVVENLSKPRTIIYSVLSLALGIVSIVLCCCSGWIGLAIGVLGIVFSVVSRYHLGYFDGLSIAGMVLGICGALFGLAFIVLGYMIESGALDGYLEEFFVEPAPGDGVTNPGETV